MLEFKLFLIVEFQRLKEEESKSLEWDVRRVLSKINYRLHTDAVKEFLVPIKVNSNEYISTIYASEADLLNLAVFGMTAKKWRNLNPKLKGNIKDNATPEQLLILANVENLNAQFIKEGMEQKERLEQLNEIAIYQMGVLINTPSFKALKDSSLKELPDKPNKDT